MKLTLNIEHSDTGLWFVTSDQVRGFLVAENNLQRALGKVPDALADLHEAYSQMDGPTPSTADESAWLADFYQRSGKAAERAEVESIFKLFGI